VLGWRWRVVDAGGHLVTLHRMDGVPFIAAEIAWGKAWTVAAWGETSAEQGPRPPGSLCSPPRSPWPAATRPGRGNPHPAQRDTDRRRRRQRTASGQVDQEILQQAVAEEGQA